MNTIGLRKEEKAFESRVAIIPGHAKQLKEKYGINIIAEPFSQRAFSSDEYASADVITTNLEGDNASVILGIKEMPNDFFEFGKVYMFFSHTIKGQKENMPMLQKIMDIGATLIDYERVVDENGRRLIFFGNWAGMAGISDTLHSLGEYLTMKGITPNPFAGMKTTLECKDLPELKEEFQKLAERIKNEGLPESMTPFIIGFAGYGNVSRGAQEMFDILPHETISPKELGNAPPKKNVLYKCVFKEVDMMVPIDASAEFKLQEYFDYGAAKYQSIFHTYVPHLTVLMNCIYWTKKSPRLITKEFIRNHWQDEKRKLYAVGDISCDVGGAIEFTVKCTHADKPSFTYLVEEDRAEMELTDGGPIVMAVDNLPCELPREASTSFSETLIDFIPALAEATFTVPFSKLSLPREILDAIIVYQGKLTKNFEYLEQYLNR